MSRSIEVTLTLWRHTLCIECCWHWGLWVWSCCEGTSSVFSASEISGINSHLSSLTLATSHESNKGVLYVYVGAPFRWYTFFSRSKKGTYKLAVTSLLCITSSRCPSYWGSKVLLIYLKCVLACLHAPLTLLVWTSRISPELTFR